jgi:hypothetical protein
MTEKQADDSKAKQKRADDNRQRKRPAEREQLAAELSCTKLEAFDRLGQRRKDSWEAVNKALYGLMVGHAAGLVGCLTLLKDYNATSPGHLKGLGAFIWLFGLGLYLAIVSASVWIFGRFNYWIFPFTGGKRWYVPHGIRDWLTAALAFISTGLMVLAIFFAIYKFGRL